MLGELPSCWRRAEERGESVPGVLRPGIRSGRGTGNGEGGAAWGRDGPCGETGSARGTGGAANRIYRGRCQSRTVQSKESIELPGLAFLGPGGLRQASPDSVSLLGLPHRQPHVRNGRLSCRGAGEPALQVLAEVGVSE